ncbi:MAG TPA: YlxR family protein, partial [Methylomirabilota bacterium]
MTAAPQRTCIGCRKVRPKAALLRLVRGADGRVDVDNSGAARG